MAKLSDYFDIKKDPHGYEYMEVYLTGIALLRLTLTNKGTAFTQEERVALKLDGLLPPQVNTLNQQVDRVYSGYCRQPDPISKYQYLRALQERTEILFYALLDRYLEDMLPIVYTPTVGQAVQEFSYRYQSARGLSFSLINIDRANEVVQSYPWYDVRMIVATDSSAILGLGDQGYGGLAISIGKLALYTAGGGVSPYHTMPAKLDVGTDRIDLINDPSYLGVRQRRIRGDAYLEFMDKFVSAVKQRWPKAVLQWEDFAKDVAFTLLERYRDQLPSFNDDIQGTGAMALAGVVTACQLKHEAITDQRIVILGAGAGGIGVAMAMLRGMVQQGLTPEQAHSQIFVLDSKGLLVDGRDALEPYKNEFAQDPQHIADWELGGDIPTMLEVIQNAKGTVLLGLSGQSGAFTEPIIKAMYANNERPIIFPLSNPTSVSEALPEEVILWTDGQAFIATGSPFPDVQYKDRIFPIGQGNNAFIFPGLGFATILAQCSKITDAMILEAAMALSDYTIKNHIAIERVFPPVREIQEVTIYVAKRVIQCALEEGVVQNAKLAERDLDEYLRSKFWRPRYLPVIQGDSIS